MCVSIVFLFLKSEMTTKENVLRFLSCVFSLGIFVSDIVRRNSCMISSTSISILSQLSLSYLSSLQLCIAENIRGF